MRAGELQPAYDCPGGTFQGAGVKTVALFFEKGTTTRTGLVLPDGARAEPGQGQVLELEIPISLLPEQQRIVGIPDRRQGRRRVLPAMLVLW